MEKVIPFSTMKYTHSCGVELVELILPNGTKLVVSAVYTCLMAREVVCDRNNRKLDEVSLRDDKGEINCSQVLSSCVGDVHITFAKNTQRKGGAKLKSRTYLWFLSKTATNTEINAGRKYVLSPSWFTSGSSQAQQQISKRNQATAQDRIARKVHFQDQLTSGGTL